MKRNMLISEEWLIANNFKRSGVGVPALQDWYRDDGDFRISLAVGYLNNGNILGHPHMECWCGDGNGHKIIRRTSIVGTVKDSQEIVDCAKLCGIDCEWKSI